VLAAAALAAIGAAACAGWDNPTALADLDPQAEFEVGAARVETFEEVEIHVHVSESGMPMHLTHAELEMEHEASGSVRVVDMEPEGDGYAAHVTFFEAGDYHLHFGGVVDRHSISMEMGEHEVEVHRHHQVIGPYWVELEVEPAPTRPGDEGHIHLHVYEDLGDGPGNPVGSLTIGAEIHDPAAVETNLTILEEEVGEYEAGFTFGEEGVYELHVEIDIGGQHADGEFHIPVFSEANEEEPGQDDGGHGHGHG
jgi:hypothetical protein